MEQTDTRESLLDAAERLFAENGIAAASLRAITQRAGANLAAVNYHFGSKDGLVRAVFARRLKPVSEERLRLLEQCDLQAEDAIEQVVCAFLKPALRMLRKGPGARDFARLMGRAFADPNDEVRSIVMGEFRESMERFLAVFRSLLPYLKDSEVLWRFHFLAGAMGHTVSCGYMLEKFSGNQCRATDPDEALRHLVPFLAAGLRAPSVSQEMSQAS